jgi:hypothetical protein
MDVPSVFQVFIKADGYRRSVSKDWLLINSTLDDLRKGLRVQLRLVIHRGHHRPIRENEASRRD